MKPTRVLITGGSGFLGTAITSALLASTSASVIVLDPKPFPSSTDHMGGRVEHVAAGLAEFLSQPGAEHRFDAVVHLIWTTYPATSAKDVEYDAASNILPTIGLLQRCAGMGVSRFVFASSGGTVYGPTGAGLVDETHPTNPISAYGVSKLAAEKYAALIGGMAGFCPISLRVSNPVGHFQLQGHPIGSIAAFLLAVHRGQPITLFGDGGIVRDYLSIDDVADAFVLAVTSAELPAGAYNVGSGIGRSLNDLIAMIREITGQTALINRLPGRPFDVPKIVLDSSRYRRITGWTAKRGLDKEVASMWHRLINPHHQ